MNHNQLDNYPLPHAKVAVAVSKDKSRRNLVAAEFLSKISEEDLKVYIVKRVVSSKNIISLRFWANTIDTLFKNLEIINHNFDGTVIANGFFAGEKQFAVNFKVFGEIFSATWNPSEKDFRDDGEAFDWNSIGCLQYCEDMIFNINFDFDYDLMDLGE